MSNRYLNKAAVLWALYEAPDVPARLLSTLIVFASFASSDGRSTYPAVSTVATLTRKSERQVKRDVAELIELKLMQPGNQRTVAHIRKDRRPVVYDLAMPVDSSPRGVTHDTPHRGNGVTSMTARGDIHGHHGVSPMTPEEVLKTSGSGERDADASHRARLEDAVPMADSLARLREMFPRVMNSAGTPRVFEIIAPGIGFVIGDDEDHRRMAELLRLDAQLDALFADLPSQSEP